MAKLRDVAILCLASASALQAQHRFPLRYVGPVEARSSVSIGTTFPVLRSLPDGRLLVTDTARHRSLVLDASLNVVSATPDSTAPRAAYVFVGATRRDSAPLVRINAQTGVFDTVTRIRVTSSKMRLDTLKDGAMRWRATLEVLPTIDEWTTLADGTVAVVRGADYHIDWYRPDGTHNSTPAMQIDWRRMTDAEKKMRVESTRAAYEANLQGMATESALTIDFADPSTLPDFMPPVFVGGVKSDPQGNVWVVPASSSYAGWAGFMYDRVSRSGEILDRIRFPKDRVLVGFGDNGSIYMVAMEAEGMFLERASSVLISKGEFQ
jgi:hypothetical protein